MEKGDRIVLQCNATGEYYPPDEMDWFRNGERISSQRHRGVRISKQYSISKRTFTSVLVIDRANMHDDGTYVCRSSNMQITSTKVHVLNGKYLSILIQGWSSQNTQKNVNIQPHAFISKTEECYSTL